MEKLLIHESKYEIELFRSRINRGFLLCTEILYHLDTLEIQAMEDIEEFEKLLQNPTGYLISKLPETSAKLFGIEVNPEKAFSLLNLNFSSVTNLMKGQNIEYIKSFLEVACFDDRGFLQINTELFEKVVEKYRIYAITPEEIEFWRTYEEVIQGINSLIRLGVQPSTFTAPNYRVWLGKRQNSRYFDVNYKFFKNF